MNDHPNTSEHKHQTNSLLFTLEEFLLLAEPETIQDLQTHLERQGSGLSAHELVDALSTVVTLLEQSEE